MTGQWRVRSWAAFVLCAGVVGAACGRPTSPGAVSQDRFAILAPASASSDLVRMFTLEGQAEWAEARGRLRGFQFYQQSLRTSCASCGNNSVARLLGALPEGAFRYLASNQIQIGVEAGAVKEHTCDGRRLAEVVVQDMAPVYASGGHVTYIAMDEPFTAALAARAPSPFGRCNFDIDRTAVEVAAFVNGVKRVHPAIRVGLIEPYPYFTVDELTTFVRVLEDNVGVDLPFFRLDYDLRHRLNVDANSISDLKKLREFLAGRGIEFELIVTGYDGRTDAPSVASAMALAYEVSGAVGKPHAVVFQDWSTDRLGLGTAAVNLPERQVGSLTWLVNNGIGVFR